MEVAQGESGLVHEQVDLSEAEVGAAQAILDGKVPGSGRRELLRQPHRLFELPRCFACPAHLAVDVSELLVGDRAAQVGGGGLGAGGELVRPAIAVSSRLRRMSRVSGVSPSRSWTSKTSLSIGLQRAGCAARQRLGRCGRPPPWRSVPSALRAGAGRCSREFPPKTTSTATADSGQGAGEARVGGGPISRPFPRTARAGQDRPAVQEPAQVVGQRRPP